MAARALPWRSRRSFGGLTPVRHGRSGAGARRTGPPPGERGGGVRRRGPPQAGGRAPGLGRGRRGADGRRTWGASWTDPGRSFLTLLPQFLDGPSDCLGLRPRGDALGPRIGTRRAVTPAVFGTFQRVPDLEDDRPGVRESRHLKANHVLPSLKEACGLWVLPCHNAEPPTPLPPEPRSPAVACFLLP